MSCSTVTTQSDPSVASSRNPAIIGHRGGSLEVPENTLAAFRYSRDLGPEMAGARCSNGG